MKALLLEDVEKMGLRQVPDPILAPHEVLIKVDAVGICGTDLHLYRGHGNYNFDARGKTIPLTVHPQILGHEFCGEILEAGSEVKDLKSGERVLCDQGRNCVSRNTWPRCPYCSSGDSHQCESYAEHGITGLPGALADFIAMPAVNCLKLPGDMPSEQGALVEPLGCVIHACDCVERAHGRFSFDKEPKIENILICGAGPAGLLFLQYLRAVKSFERQILVSDRREKNLKLVERFGGTPVNVAEQDLGEAVEEFTHGKRIQYLVEACAAGSVFSDMPTVLSKKATVLIYGAGHKGADIAVLDHVLFLEPTLVASVGASGGFDNDGRPTTYRRALELVSSGRVNVLDYVTHRYQSLEGVKRAFEEDFQKRDYIKGVMTVA